jgi:flagellar FliJ protein
MKAFKFSLESVLTLRRREEEAARESYSEALAFRSRCELALEQAMQDLEALQSELTEKRSGLTRRDDHLLFIHAIRQQKDYCTTVSQRLARAEQLVQARHGVWMEARRKTQMLERLKEKQQLRHRYEMERAEERLIDDLVAARFGFGGRSVDTREAWAV